MSERSDLDGLGFFYASADMAREPAESARRCAQAGASWAMILIESVDGRRQSPERVLAHAAALRARSIRALAYTFPSPRGCETLAGLDQATDRAIEIARGCGIEHLCFDFEPFERADWTGTQIRRAVARARAAGLRSSVTIFTRARWRKITWPAGVPVILQVYERARLRGLLAAALRQTFPGADPDTIPAIGTYAGDADRLGSDLDNIREWDPRGLAIWSLATTDVDERRALAAYVRGDAQGSV